MYISLTYRSFFNDFFEPQATQQKQTNEIIMLEVTLSYTKICYNRDSILEVTMGIEKDLHLVRECSICNINGLDCMMDMNKWRIFQLNSRILVYFFVCRCCYIEIFENIDQRATFRLTKTRYSYLFYHSLLSSTDSINNKKPLKIVTLYGTDTK